MFLHSGAAMHRHEFSAPLDPTRRHSMPIRSPLTRSAFSSPIPRITTTYEKPIPIIHPAGRTLSEYVPRPTEHTVRFQEPDTDTMSDGGMSIANSEGSEATAGGSRRRRRSSRTSTTFQLAHPAPTLTQKQRLLLIRPKLLLQIQRLAPDTRPRPALDVLPSTLVVPRLKAKFPRMFKGKAELGVNDVMVVKSEEYDRPDAHSIEPTDSDEEGVSNRELIAVICQMRKDLGGHNGKAEIVLHDSVWSATPVGNNIYEFISVNEQGEQTRARWVRRITQRKSIDLSTAATDSNNEFKFTFSILSPNTRRHPIMGTLTQSTLNIPDQYVSVSSSAGRHPPTSPMHSLQDDQSDHEEPTTERTTHVIDEDVKTLIQVTGIWVALRQGVSPHFKYNDSMACSTPLASPRLPATSRVNSSTLTPDGTKFPSVDPLSTTPESSRSTFGSVKGKIQRSCSKASPVISSIGQPDGPRRALSAGTAFMQRAEARKAKHPPSTVISDSEGEIFEPPKRARTDILPPSHGALMNLNHLNLSSPTAAPPLTPTRSQRRVQSAYIPPSALQIEHSVARHSLDGTKQSPAGSERQKVKTSRWKAFTNLFRRSRTSDSEG